MLTTDLHEDGLLLEEGYLELALQWFRCGDQTEVGTRFFILVALSLFALFRRKDIHASHCRVSLPSSKTTAPARSHHASGVG